MQKELKNALTDYFSVAQVVLLQSYISFRWCQINHSSIWFIMCFPTWGIWTVFTPLMSANVYAAMISVAYGES